MLVTGIKSKPVYAPLRADTRGRYHLMLGLGVGAAPLHRVVEEMQGNGASLANTRVLLVEGDAAPFRAAGAGQVESFGTKEALLERFRAILTESLMGTRLYVAGPESFIGLAMKVALAFDLKKDEIRAEECGSLARRVYCIHCRATAEDVRTNIVTCPGCQRWLLVRDHYSRRLAAYMGVMVDAEAPGELPEIKQVFL